MPPPNGPRRLEDRLNEMEADIRNLRTLVAGLAGGVVGVDLDRGDPFRVDPGEAVFWLDGNTLWCRVGYADGTSKTGSLALF